jgi:regulator of ribonuclease activity A
MDISTADLYDQHGENLASVPLQFQNLGGHTAFTGPIAVLVVDGGGSLNSALMGDMIAGAAVANGWAGVVINGAIRDRGAIAGLPLGVKALGSNPRKSAKDSAGEVDVTVEFGGVAFRPGAVLYADGDGILVER